MWLPRLGTPPWAAPVAPCFWLGHGELAAGPWEQLNYPAGTRAFGGDQTVCQPRQPSAQGFPARLRKEGTKEPWELEKGTAWAGAEAEAWLRVLADPAWRGQLPRAQEGHFLCPGSG